MYRAGWAYLTVLAVALGLAAGNAALTAAGALFLLAAAAGLVWSRWALTRVESQLSLSATRVFPGETVEFVVQTTNRKPLPVPWLEVELEVPRRLPLAAATVAPFNRDDINLLSGFTALRWYERVTWRYRVDCATRGFYRFGPIRLRSGDIFGFFERERRLSGQVALIVYPRLLALADLGIAARRPFGEQRSRLRLVEDPAQVAGVREWQVGDPFKRLAWKATAQHGRLHSKVYDPATTRQLVVALDLATLPRPWQGADPELLELNISAAASFAGWGFDAGYAVGLVANGNLPLVDRWLRIPCNRDPGQLVRVLEALAMLTSFTTAPIEEVLRAVSYQLPYGSSVVVVAALAEDPLCDRLARLAAAGAAVALLLSRSGSLPTIPRVSVSRIDVADNGTRLAVGDGSA